ncbi:MAG: PEP-CTERM sorting domain-containing protein [bacterium]
MATGSKTMESGMRDGRRRERVFGVLAGLALLLAAGAATATPARFAESRFGFVDIEAGLPQLTMGEGDPFLAAGDPTSGESVDIEMIGSTNLCILAEGSSTCRASTGGLTTPYAAIMSVEINVLNPELEDGPFTLLLTGLGAESDPTQVGIELAPVVPAGFDPSTVPGFVFDPSNGVGGFDRAVEVSDLTYADRGVIYSYVGFTVRDGDRLTFWIDVSSAPDGQGAPQLFANATPVVVPEPGTALLMGLGLAGLGWAGRPRR